jgi:hypothetical protein
MTNEEKYMKIRNNLQERVDNDLLTEEKANEINDLAWNKYMSESSKVEDAVAEIEKLAEAVKNGNVKLSKDDLEEISEMLNKGSGDSDDDSSDDSSDDAAEGEAETDEESCSKESADLAIESAIDFIDAYLNAIDE